MSFQVDFTCHYYCTKFHPIGLQANEKMREGGKQPPGFHEPKYARPYCGVQSNITKMSKLHTQNARCSTTLVIKHERQFNKW